MIQTIPNVTFALREGDESSESSDTNPDPYGVSSPESVMAFLQGK